MGAAEKTGERGRKKLENEKIKRKYSTLTRRRTVDAGERKNNNAGKDDAKEMFIKVFLLPAEGSRAGKVKEGEELGGR